MEGMIGRDQGFEKLKTGLSRFTKQQLLHVETDSFVQLGRRAKRQMQKPLDGPNSRGVKALSSKISSEVPFRQFPHVQRKFKHFVFWLFVRSNNPFRETMGNTPSMIFSVFQNLKSIHASIAETYCPLKSLANTLRPKMMSISIAVNSCFE